MRERFWQRERVPFWRPVRKVFESERLPFWIDAWSFSERRVSFFWRNRERIFFFRVRGVVWKDRKRELWECEMGYLKGSRERALRAWEEVVVLDQCKECFFRGLLIFFITGLLIFVITGLLIFFFFFLSPGCWSIIALTPRHNWCSSTHPSSR